MPLFFIYINNKLISPHFLNYLICKDIAEHKDSAKYNIKLFKLCQLAKKKEIKKATNLTHKPKYPLMNCDAIKGDRPSRWDCW